MNGRAILRAAHRLSSGEVWTPERPRARGVIAAVTVPGTIVLWRAPSSVLESGLSTPVLEVRADVSPR